MSAFTSDMSCMCFVGVASKTLPSYHQSPAASAPSPAVQRKDTEVIIRKQFRRTACEIRVTLKQDSPEKCAVIICLLTAKLGQHAYHVRAAVC